MAIMMQHTATAATPKATASFACAAAAFILILRTLSILLSVLLVAAVLGILIRLALTRRNPQQEQS